MIAHSQSRPVEIIGGGLAGLGLALGLRRADVPVVLVEAGDYPRHRVCGEFITSLDPLTINTLGLEPMLVSALPAHSVTWFKGSAQKLSQRLPEPALCLSRYHLDEAMARALIASGGEIKTRQREAIVAQEGRVLTTGRRPATQSPYVGIKAHFQHLKLRDDLELHLGDHAYVGLTRIEDGRVNVCGLFRRSPAAAGAKVSKQSILDTQLRSAGLGDLADRLAHADLDHRSICTVAGLDYEAMPNVDGLHLGDQFGLIPPFTGNGMTVALQSARLAVAPLRNWSRGQIDWPTAIHTIHQSLHRELAPRIKRARRLHPWLLTPRRQRWLVAAASRRLVPTHLLYRLLH